MKFAAVLFGPIKFLEKLWRNQELHLLGSDIMEPCNLIANLLFKETILNSYSSVIHCFNLYNDISYTGVVRVSDASFLSAV